MLVLFLAEAQWALFARALVLQYGSGLSPAARLLLCISAKQTI